MFYIGVVPSVDGIVCILEGDVLYKMIDVPTQEVDGQRVQRAVAIYEMVKAYSTLENSVAAIEAGPQTYGRGLFHMAFIASEVPFLQVPPEELVRDPALDGFDGSGNAKRAVQLAEWMRAEGRADQGKKKQ